MKQWLLSLLLWRVAPTCHNSRDALFSAYNNDAEVLAVIETHIPASVKDVLGWSSRDTILDALGAPRLLQWTELFCGTGTLSKHLGRVLPRGRSIDTQVGDSSHDILTPVGYAHVLRTIISLAPWAFCWLAPPCSLWVFLSAGVHKRSLLRPSGDTTRADIRASNLIAHRCCVICRILTLRLVQWIIEQPVTSCFFRFSSFVKLRDSKRKILRFGLQRKFLWLGHWGGNLKKPTALWGISPALDRLHSKRPKSMPAMSVKKTTLKTIFKDGRWQVVHRIYGVRKVLRNSQVYPERFCKELAGHVALIYKRSLSSFKSPIWS